MSRRENGRISSGRKGSANRKNSAGRSSSRQRGMDDGFDDEFAGARMRAGMGMGAGGMTAPPNSNTNDSLPLVLFNQTKNELKPLQAFKQLQSKLRGQYRFQTNKDELSRDRLEGVRILVFAGSRQRFDSNEVKVLNDFMTNGGSILLLGHEPTEQNQADDAAVNEGNEGVRSLSPDDYTVINKLSEGYGVALQADALVRTVYAKDYFHPKEVLIQDAALLPTIDRLTENRQHQTGTSKNESKVDDEDNPSKLAIVYPYGATLRVTKPALPLLTSGVLSFPAHRALAAIARAGRGCLAMIGSASMLSDDFLLKADNFLFIQHLFQRLVTEETRLETIDGDLPEFQEVQPVPDTESLAERLRVCLQETEELPVDFTQMFDSTLFKFDTNLIPEAVKLYERLNVKHEPLSLIPPQFEVPLPPLQPAVFMPCLRELPPPALDLFDLDEHLSSEKLRLAQITNKCTDADLEYFICEAGEILGIADQIRAQQAAASSSSSASSATSPTGSQASKAPQIQYSATMVLDFILRKLIDWKKLDRDGSAGGDGGMGMGMGMMGGGSSQGFDGAPVVSPNGTSQTFTMPNQDSTTPSPTSQQGGGAGMQQLPESTAFDQRETSAGDADELDLDD